MVHLVPKRCRVVQHTLDTQHVFFASFHYDNRLYGDARKDLQKINYAIHL